MVSFRSKGAQDVGFLDRFIDAFGRQRVSSPTNLWTSEFQYNKHPLFFDEVLAVNGTATHLPNESAVSLAVTAENGSRSMLQTFEYLRYQPGKSHVIAMTFVAASPQANTSMRVGYFDDDNGVYIEQAEASNVNVVRRSKTSGSVVNDAVLQADWNRDKLDGSGGFSNPSGITLDLNKGQLFWVDLQWLSLGRIRVGFDIGGVLVYIHEFLGANVLDVPTISTGNLPIRWEIVNTGVAAGAKTLKAICSTVFSEGGTQVELGHTFTGGNGATFITTIGTTPKNLFSVRPALTLNSITNRVKVDFTGLDIFADDAMLWEIIYKPDSITGASFASPVTHSSVEVDVAGTAIVGGVPVASGYIAASNKGGLVSIKDLNSKFPFFLDAAGTNQSRGYTVQVRTLGGANKQAVGQVNWEEVR